jgi:hypothetical protein
MPPFPPERPFPPGPPVSDRSRRPTLVTVAGIGLIAGGGVEVLVSVAAVAVAIHDMVSYHELRLMSLFPVVGVVAGLVTVAGGIQLLRGRTRSLVYAGAIASMVPGTLCCVLGLAFGILSLVILPRPEVRAHFGEPAPPPAAPFPPSFPPPAPPPTPPAE